MGRGWSSLAKRPEKQARDRGRTLGLSAVGADLA